MIQIKKLIFVFLSIFIIMPLSSMEELPGSDDGTDEKNQLHYFVEQLNGFQTNTIEGENDFENYFEKIKKEFFRVDPLIELHLYLGLLIETIATQNHYIINKICLEIIKLYKNKLEGNQFYHELALSAINVQIFENIEPQAPFEGLIILKEALTKRHPLQRKEKSSQKPSELLDSKLFDDEQVASLCLESLENWPSTKEEFRDLINNFSPNTQFNLVETCIKSSLEVNKIAQANDLYEYLATIYQLYFLETHDAFAYKKRFEFIAKNNNNLATIKIGGPDLFSQVKPTAFDSKKFEIVQVKSPRRTPRKQNEPSRPGKGTLSWTTPRRFDLESSPKKMLFFGKIVIVINQHGGVDCYEKGSWVNSFQYPGSAPINIVPGKLELTTNEIQTTQIKIMGVRDDSKISILSTELKPPPLCTVFTKGDKHEYLMQGNSDGSVLFHDIPRKKIQQANQKHDQAITALFALSSTVAYSGSSDGTIKKFEQTKDGWNCIGSLSELQGIPRKIVELKNNLFTLLGEKKLAHFSIDPKAQTILPVYQENNSLIETVTPFAHTYLIVGLKNGKFKAFQYDHGFGCATEIDPELGSPIETLLATEKKLLVHYKNNAVFIFNKNKKQ